MENDNRVMDGNRTEPNHLATLYLHVREQSLYFSRVTVVADSHGREKSYVDSILRGVQTMFALYVLLYC